VPEYKRQHAFEVVWLTNLGVEKGHSLVVLFFSKVQGKHINPRAVGMIGAYVWNLAYTTTLPGFPHTSLLRISYGYMADLSPSKKLYHPGNARSPIVITQLQGIWFVF
jgi:hypothetical protein